MRDPLHASWELKHRTPTKGGSVKLSIDLHMRHDHTPALRGDYVGVSSHPYFRATRMCTRSLDQTAVLGRLDVRAARRHEGRGPGSLYNRNPYPESEVRT